MYTGKSVSHRLKKNLNLENRNNSFSLPLKISPKLPKRTNIFTNLDSSSIEKKEESGFTPTRIYIENDADILKASNVQSLPKIHFSPRVNERFKSPKNVSFEKPFLKDPPQNKLKLFDLILNLSQAVGSKYQNDHLLLPEWNDLKNTISALEIISEEESPYYDLMQNIVKIVKLGLYFNKDFMDKPDSLWNNIDNQTYKKLSFANETLKLPYYKVCTLLLKDIHRKSEQTKALILDHTQKLNEQKRMIEKEYERLIQDLRLEHSRALKLKDLEHEAQIKILHDQIDNFKIQLEQSQSKTNEERKEKNVLIDSVEVLKAEKRELAQKVLSLYEKHTTKDSLNRQNEDKKVLLKSKSRAVKEEVDKLVLDLNSLKYLVKSLQKERNDLVFERNRYKGIVGTDADNLTPRPDCKQILSDKKLEFGITTESLTKDQKVKKMSTTKAMEDIISKYMAVLQHNQFLEAQLRGEYSHNASPHRVSSKTNAVKLLTPKIKTNNSMQANKNTPQEIKNNRKLSTLSIRKRSSFVSNDDDGSFRSKVESKAELKDTHIETEKNASNNKIREEINNYFFQYNENDLPQLDEKSPAGNLIKSFRDLNDEKSFSMNINEAEEEDDVLYPLGERILTVSDQLFEKIDKMKALFDDFVQSYC